MPPRTGEQTLERRAEHGAPSPQVPPSAPCAARQVTLGNDGLTSSHRPSGGVSVPPPRPPHPQTARPSLRVGPASPASRGPCRWRRPPGRGGSGPRPLTVPAAAPLLPLRRYFFPAEAVPAPRPPPAPVLGVRPNRSSPLVRALGTPGRGSGQSAREGRASLS